MQGRAVAEGRTLNPQAGAGADVMSRLAVARVAEGRAVLAGLARRQLLGIMDSLAKSGTGRVTRLCLAAITAMTDIFLDRDVEGLCAAPYRLAHSGDETVALPDFPPLYVPPLPAPFVGGAMRDAMAFKPAPLGSRVADGARIHKRIHRPPQSTVKRRNPVAPPKAPKE